MSDEWCLNSTNRATISVQFRQAGLKPARSQGSKPIQSCRLLINQSIKHPPFANERDHSALFYPTTLVYAKRNRPGTLHAHWYRSADHETAQIKWQCHPEHTQRKHKQEQYKQRVKQRWSGEKKERDGGAIPLRRAHVEQRQGEEGRRAAQNPSDSAKSGRASSNPAGPSHSTRDPVEKPGGTAAAAAEG